MSQTHTCPVCGRRGLPPNCGNCPQCDADLTCFQALDSLAGPTAAKTAAALPPKRRFPWVAIAIIVTAVLLLLAGLSVSMKNRLSKLDHQLAELKAAEQRAAMKKKHEESVSSAPKNKNVVGPVLPPESKIHIDAQVRILDERETATAAAKQEPVGENHQQTSGKNTEALHVAEKQSAAPVAKEKRELALVPDEPPVSQKKMVEAVAAENEATKVVREEVLPDTAEVELVGSKMPPPVPVEKTAEQAASLAPAEKKSANPAEVEAAVVVTEPPPIPSENNAELAILPEMPPVVLTPKYRKHRVKSIVMKTVDTPAAEQVQTVPVQRGGTFSYLVKDGENAWDIAERFYGDRKYYPVVMEQNPHIFLGFIRKGSSVRLFADRREAAAFYQRKIEQREGLILWKYQVRSDETWRSIYARFFLPRYSSMIFYGNQEVIPGKTVKIILR